MARKPHVMTPARWAALRKAQLAAQRANKGKKRSARAVNRNRRHYGAKTNKNRGSGTPGLKKNFTPYVRVNKSSQTVGANTGTIIPFTGKRVAFGFYTRLESTNRKNNVVDAAIRGASRSLAPAGSKTGAVAAWLKKNVRIETPATRVALGSSQVRLGTSRRAGPTVIVRRGAHKTMESKSYAGIKKYRKSMSQPKRRKARRGRR